MSEWQDIATAPKDGTTIDLWIDDERIADCIWSVRRNRWENWWLNDFGTMGMVEVGGNPTHWMPLPEPPK